MNPLDRRAYALFVALLIIVMARSAQATPPEHAFPEPDGFGQAKFGMMEAHVKQLYPKMRLVVTPTPAPGQQLPPFTLTTYTLEDQTSGPLRHCTVGLRFFNSELYEVQFRCPEKDKTTEYLKATFGTPTEVTDSTLGWRGQKSAVTHVPAGGVFMFGDLARSQKMTLTMMSYLGKVQQRGVPAAVAPPATPAPTQP